MNFKNLLPWIVLGDFNQTLHPEEHSKPSSLNIDAQTRLFREALLEADLADLTYKGPKFTWTNKSKTNLTAKKLDRVLVNDPWLSLIPDSIAVFGEPDFSEHAVCTVILKPSSVREKRPFRFYNFLLHNEQFLDYLTELWYSTNVTGSAMFTISMKLKLLKSDIRTFSRDNYSNLERRVEESHIRLLSAQQNLLLLPSEASRFLFQRSHINSIKGGDCNSAYFHRLIATRRSSNHIHYLLDDQANLNRLPMKMRLASWGLNIPTACCFCNNHDETREHLFLTCTYSTTLWKMILERLDPHRLLLLTWEELLSWLRLPSPSTPTTLKKLGTQSLLYNVWRQRNSEVHLTGFSPSQTTFNSIDRDIRNTITARRHKRKFSPLMQLWIR
ncbi:hypothetical protein Bca52824_017130 [Brassica carinata]|uniref:Reverse transcriptase zinc-binding domain-containing protein n=1 Tax=Brassica carinata TaxID=52824 RepID=A0A8X7VMZ9_BRACI|nr:hypothetical protein Bca52824_017130 [Brassica carinata]